MNTDVTITVNIETLNEVLNTAWAFIGAMEAPGFNDWSVSNGFPPEHATEENLRNQIERLSASLNEFEEIVEVAVAPLFVDGLVEILGLTEEEAKAVVGQVKEN